MKAVKVFALAMVALFVYGSASAQFMHHKRHHKIHHRHHRRHNM